MTATLPTSVFDMFFLLMQVAGSVFYGTVFMACIFFIILMMGRVSLLSNLIICITFLAIMSTYYVGGLAMAILFCIGLFTIFGIILLWFKGGIE